MATSRRAGGTSTTRRLGRGSKIQGPPETPFTLHYPGGWRKVAKGELQKLENTPAAAIRRSDERGIVTLAIRGRLEQSLEELGPDLVKSLSERFDDFELVTSRTMEVDAGPALYTSWVLRDEGRVQGNLTVPAGDRTYTLDAAMPIGATDVARDVGAIFASFALERAD